MYSGPWDMIGPLIGALLWCSSSQGRASLHPVSASQSPWLLSWFSSLPIIDAALPYCFYFLNLSWNHPLLCHGHHSSPSSVTAAEPTAEAALPPTSVIIYTHTHLRGLRGSPVVLRMTTRVTFMDDKTQQAPVPVSPSSFIWKRPPSCSRAPPPFSLLAPTGS